ncbi:MAG: hypothetical protein HY722_02370 [Planctomycetes bacterium]|nr:hypothetical protein [Planctomycetota bacterium]
MAKKRAKRKRPNGNGAHPFVAAYRSALVQVVFDEAYEDIQRDPQRMEIVRRFLRDIAATYAD